MPNPRPLPPDLTGRPFTVRAARESGVARGRLRAKDLAAPFHGIRLPTRDADDLLARCRAYAVGTSTDHVFAFATAAQLQGIPLPRRLEEDERVHVLYRDAARAPRGRGVVGHKTGREVGIVERGGVQMTDPVTTWLALANLLSLDQLVVAGDRLVAWRDPLVAYDEFAAAVAAHSGARGAKRARAAFSEVRVGSRSPRETRCRLTLVRAGLPEPELNAPIAVDGRIIHADLAYRELRILFEYDSVHRIDDTQWGYDLRRYNALSASGWIVIRIAKSMTDAEVVAAARGALHRRGALP